MGLSPRGIRNNNPGNIRWSRDEWQGLVPQSERTDKSFCQFTDGSYGIRALAKVLINYGKRQGMPGVGDDNIDTIREIISRWAPPSENNTESYIRTVANAVGVEPDAHINIRDMGTLTKLVKSIILHENGQQPYTDALIERAVRSVI